MEPERKIEKLLRAYAQKRRANAGGPLIPHPVTRRLLQDEAARRASPPDAEDDSVSLWQLFRQQWAFLLGFALVIFFAAAMLLPAISTAKHKVQSIAAVSDLKQIGAAAQLAAEQNNGQLPASLDALTNGFVAGKILTDPVSGKKFVYVAGGENLDDLSNNAVLAYSPGDENGCAVLFADGRVEYARGAQLAGLTNQESLPVALAESVTGEEINSVSAPTAIAMAKALAPTNTGTTILAANSVENQREPAVVNGSGKMGFALNSPVASPPPIAADRRLAPATGLLQTNAAQFAETAFLQMRLALKPTASFQDSLAISNRAPVLENFQMRQSGADLAVVDSDGSTYRGSLQFGNGTNRGAVGGEMEAPAARRFFFRVAGTNLTLKQNVVFTGNLLVISNATAGLPQSLSLASGLVASPRSALTNQLPWPDLRIEGMAVIAGTNAIPVSAAPLPR
ncbi:MAG TPA: hypothetical protein VMD27_01290 [Candidatus Aquilonibacter sp.]|nr:hypothetical protein [Candidatus Aquilonibacter sp.]